MRFIIVEYAGGKLRENEEILPFGSTTAEALNALNARFLQAVDNFDNDGRKRWLTISISPDDDPVLLPPEDKQDESIN